MIPEYLVKVGGVDYTSRFASRIKSIRIHDGEGLESDTCDLEFDNKNQSISIPPTGDVVEVSLGYRRDLQKMGRFIVTDRVLRGMPLSLSISCKAADLRATMKERRFDTYENMTIAQIVQKIASRNGLKASAMGSVGKILYDYLAQTGESDLAFIRRLGRVHDAISSPKMGELIFARKGEIDFGTLTVVPRDVISFETPLRDRPKYSSTSACYWDSDKAEQKLEIVSGGEGKVRLNLGGHYPDGLKQAAEAARAQNAAMQREAKTCSLSMIGNPRLKAEMRIKMKGFSASSDGTYRIKSADHDFGEGGYITDVEGEAL
ncbi:MAG: hypothetical protein DSY80_06940 [Desulfocapsa sp.]|nr:MAG: hypothetical protein DSY80_06940 [Desulfocapsa sp.]